MRRLVLTGFLVAGLTSSGAVQAQEAAKGSAEPKFMTTYDMRQQAGRELEAAEAELEKVLSKLRSLLYEEAQKKKLQSSQDAWLNYRKLNADFEAFFWEGGTGKPQIHLRAITLMTKSRTAELQRIIDENFGH